MVADIDQRRASAQGDIVAGDKTEKHYHAPEQSAGIVEQLLKKLKVEIEENEEVKHTIEQLKHFYDKRSHDGIEGLEAKLEAGDRSDEYMIALEKKELFVKLLEEWSLYASAQEIFAYLLAKAEHEFTYFIHPEITKLEKVAVNQLVNDRIVDPLLQECGASVFSLNHSVMMGMLYWLAEQCFVRWHE